LLATARRRPRWTFAALFVIYALLVGAWAGATPIGQTPDEWAHIFRASTVVQGELLIPHSGPVNAVNGDAVRVPQMLANRPSQTKCYPFRPKVPVSCARKSSGSQNLVETSTPAARYPPVYYAVVGWPLAFGAYVKTFYGMRLIAVLLSALLLASGALAALRLRAGFAMAGYFVAVTPMVAYLGGMINPNGIEIAGGAALWPNLLLWLDAPDPRHRRAGLLGATIAAVTIVVARTVAIIWVAVAVLALLVLIKREWFKTEVLVKRTLLGVGAVIAAAIFAGVWALVSGALSIAPTLINPTHHTLAQNLQQAWHRLPIVLHEALAFFGWLDTPLRGTYYHLFYAAFFAMVGLALLGVLRGRWRPGIAASLAFALTVAVTMYMMAREANTLSINFWQGRYSLPMAVGVPILLGFAAGSWRGRARWAAAGIAGLVSASVEVVYVNGFVRFFKRNSVGINSKPLSLTGGWQPPLGMITWLIVLLVALAALGLITVLAAASGGERAAPEPETLVAGTNLTRSW
jgi:Predicted membrane protein (DUF2142).